LPEVQDLWIHDAAGHYCCEFRMTLYLDGEYSKGSESTMEYELKGKVISGRHHR